MSPLKALSTCHIFPNRQRDRRLLSKAILRVVTLVLTCLVSAHASECSRELFIQVLHVHFSKIVQALPDFLYKARLAQHH